MEFRGKEKRLECYKARDAYFEKCEIASTEPKLKAQCQELYKHFELACGQKWTEHFIRKQDYLKFKKKIEEQGFEEVDQRIPTK